MTKTAIDPQGGQTVTYTGARENIVWATFAKFSDGWSHVGWSSAVTEKAAIRAARSTAPYAIEWTATPAV